MPYWVRTTALFISVHLLLKFYFLKCCVENVCLGPPSKPKGPLEVLDVQKDSATIAWKKPEDDGGKPIK